MPNLKSKAEMKFLFAKKPAVGKDMADYSKAHGVDLKKLPEHVPAKKKK